MLNLTAVKENKEPAKKAALIFNAYTANLNQKLITYEFWPPAHGSGF